MIGSWDIVGDVFHLYLSITCRSCLTCKRCLLLYIEGELTCKLEGIWIGGTAILIIDSDVSTYIIAIHSIDTTLPLICSHLYQTQWLLSGLWSSCRLEGVIVLTWTYLIHSYQYCKLSTLYAHVLYLCTEDMWRFIFLDGYLLTFRTVIRIAYIDIPWVSRGGPTGDLLSGALKGLIQDDLTTVGSKDLWRCPLLCRRLCCRHTYCIAVRGYPFANLYSYPC